jgi:hypothetical protein
MPKRWCFVHFWGAGAGLLVLLLFVSAGFAAHRVALSPAQGQNLNFQVVESNYDRVVLRVEINSLSVEELDTKGGRFAELSLDNYGYTNIVGEPRLPLIRKQVQIPFGAEADVKVTSLRLEKHSLKDLGIAQPLMPVQESVPKLPGARESAPFNIDSRLYAQDRYCLSERARLFETGVMRGCRFATIDIFPINYNPARGEIEIAAEITVEVTLTGSDPGGTERMLRRYWSPTMAALAERIFPNYFDLKPGLPPVPIGYVFIVGDYFIDNPYFESYIEWKKQKGFTVDVKTVSEVGGDSTGMKDYIRDQYLNGPVPPAYVLLVGDTDRVPYCKGKKTGDETDLNFTLMTTGDYIPDLEIGRFSARNDGELGILVTKSLDYERCNYTGTDWTDKACFIASTDSWNHGIAEGTHRWVIQTIMDPAGLQSDSIWGYYGGSTQDIKNALNDGRMVCDYSGHGSTTSWGGPSFSKTNIDQLTNQDMYPFVLSHACLTGSFASDDCFMEHWVRAENKGALASMGSVPSSYWDEDDIMERAMFRAFFQYGYYTIYGMMFYGNDSLYQAGFSKARYYFEGYNIMGDPAIILWFSTPRVPVVSYDPNLPSSPRGFTADVTYQGVGEEMALVACYMEGVLYGSAYTDPSGNVTVPLYPPPPDGIMTVTVTGVDLWPFEGTVQVGGGGPTVSVELSPRNTSVPRGERLIYDATATNNTGEVQDFQYWAKVRLPNGSMYGPLFSPMEVQLDPYETLTGPIRQRVPNGAPLGDYTYYGYVGIHPDDVWDSDEFDFEVVTSIAKLQADLGGWDDVIWGKPEGEESLPAVFALYQNYPNPFNANTEITYSLAEDGPVSLKIYNLKGEVVNVLVDDLKTAGEHRLTWDGKDLLGNAVSSGVYFVRLEAWGASSLSKMNLLK